MHVETLRRGRAKRACTLESAAAPAAAPEPGQTPALVAELVSFGSGVQDGNAVSVGIRVDTPGDRPAEAGGPGRIYVHGVLDPATPADSLSGGRFADVLAFLMASLNSRVLIPEANLDQNADPSPSVVTLFNTAARDRSLTIRILRAFFYGDAGRLPTPAVPVSTADEFNALSLNAKRNVMVPWAGAEMGRKCAIPRHGGGGLAGTLGRIAAANKVKNVGMHQVLKLLHLEMGSAGGDLLTGWTKMAEEAKELLGDLSSSKAFRILFDNVNVNRARQSIMHGGKTTRDFVVIIASAMDQHVAEQHIRRAYGDDVLLGLTDQTYAPTDVLTRAGGMADLIYSQDDSDCLSVQQILQAAAIFYEIDRAELRDDPLDEEPLTTDDYKDIKIPGRSAVTPRSGVAMGVDFAEAAAGWQGGCTDEMKADGIEFWEGDLKRKAVVSGLVDFVEGQISKAIGRLQNGDVDPNCFMARAKAWLHSDGDPTAGSIRYMNTMLDRLGRGEADVAGKLYKYIRVECGCGLHLSMNAFRSHRKGTRAAFVETMIKKHRDSPGKLDYFFDAPDPRQPFEEGMQWLGALALVAREAYLSDPEYTGPATAANVLARLQRRLGKFELGYAVWLDARFLSALAVLDDSQRNGGNRDDYDATFRFFMHKMSLHGSIHYLLIGRHNRITALTDSTYTRFVLKVCLWLGQTSTGQTCFPDTYVEYRVQMAKFAADAVPANRLADVLAQAAPLLAQIWASKGATTDRAPRTIASTIGSVTVGKAFAHYCATIREHNLCGVGSIDAPYMTWVKVGTKLELVEVPLDRMATLDGKRLSATQPPSTHLGMATDRLRTMYQVELNERGAPMPTGLFEDVPTVECDAVDQTNTENVLRTSSSATVLAKLKLPGTNKRLCTRERVSAMLEKIKTTRQHRIEDDDGGGEQRVDHPNWGGSALVQRLTKECKKDLTAAKNKHYDLKSDDMLDLLCDLRKEAGIKSARRVKAAGASDYPVGVPTADSQTHRVWHNALLDRIIAAGPGAKLTDAVHRRLAGVTLPIFDAALTASDAAGDGPSVDTDLDDLAGLAADAAALINTSIY